METEKIFEVLKLQQKIKEESALYFYRATPFTEHGEFNYNGALREPFFFKNLFSQDGMCNEYVKKIKKSLSSKRHKSILLIGNQGCGKTTFVHFLQKECSDNIFEFFDFDKNTSHPALSEYIEIFSNYLLSLLKSNDITNRYLYDLYIRNKKLFEEKFNAENNINSFFEEFNKVFILKNSNLNSPENFIKTINELFFNQILSLITLWYVCKFKNDVCNGQKIKPIVFCLDNLDVLVNKEIIEKFFKEYLRFVRNIDSLIQNLDDDFVKREGLYYNTFFAFLFCCRQHTWARVREVYRHDNSFIRVSTLEIDITDAFDKKLILKKREKYIEDNQSFFGNFKNNVSEIKSVLSDMDTNDSRGHNIYDLFDDDYRQCNITFEELTESNPELIENYFKIKKHSQNQLYGARGLIYKAIFEKFKEEGIFSLIGVLDLDAEEPLVSNVRMILNYLNYHTYIKNNCGKKFVTFDKIVKDFKGVISQEDIDKSLIAMFKLGDDSLWNELIAFNEIHSEDIRSCEGTEIFITKAGHEYLDLISTHFEFFNTRIIKKRTIDSALFSDDSINKCSNELYEYNFDEKIKNVLDSVSTCCEKMSKHYKDYMSKKYSTKSKYLHSPFVYGDAGVLHGERIIHTHIRYIDSYRLFILKNFEIKDKTKINELLVGYIEEYITIGENHPDILTRTSVETLFPEFKNKIKIIKASNYLDYTTRIDV